VISESLVKKKKTYPKHLGLTKSKGALYL